ncbi:MAG: hypothetical protein R2712_22870 [Vicinamibacterales bacterium]
MLHTRTCRRSAAARSIESIPVPHWQRPAGGRGIQHTGGDPVIATDQGVHVTDERQQLRLLQPLDGGMRLDGATGLSELVPHRSMAWQPAAP